MLALQNIKYYIKWFVVQFFHYLPQFLNVLQSGPIALHRSVFQVFKNRAKVEPYRATTFLSASKAIVISVFPTSKHLLDR